MYAILYSVGRKKARIMRRRQFLHTLTTTPAASLVVAEALAEEQSSPSTDGFTLVSEFSLEGDSWKVWEDLRKDDLRNQNGSFLYVSARGRSRTLSKSGEPSYADAGPAHPGLEMNDVGTAGADLLADLLLKGGDPDPAQVRSAAPPQGSGPAPPNGRVAWNTDRKSVV